MTAPASACPPARPAPSEPPLGFVLVDAARLYRARIDRAFEGTGLGLTAGEARTLAYVDFHPGLRQSALAEKMNVEPMTLVVSSTGSRPPASSRAKPTPRTAAPRS